MLNKYYILLLMLNVCINAQPDLIVYANKGKTLSPQKRSLLITWQKKAASIRTPYHVTQQLQLLQQNNTICQDLKRLKESHKHTITWEQLEKKDQTFFIFGFGSLINAHSYLNTQCQPNINIPGIVFGVKRLYGMTHPQPENSCVGLPAPGHEHEELRLDTQITGNATDCTNGILLKFTIGTQQYEYLKKRERKYNLIPIKVIDYRSLFGNPHFYNAYILCGKHTINETQKKPHIMYNSIVIEGAQHIENQGNAGFLSLLLDTTFLPDSKTTLRKWLIAQ